MKRKPAAEVRVGDVISDMHGRKWEVWGLAEATHRLAPYALGMPRIRMSVALESSDGIHHLEAWDVAPGDLLPVMEGGRG